MKGAKPSTKTSKKARGEVSTTAPAFVDQLVVEEIVVVPTAALDPIANPIITPLSLCAIMETFMTT